MEDDEDFVPLSQVASRSHGGGSHGMPLVAETAAAGARLRCCTHILLALRAHQSETDLRGKGRWVQCFSCRTLGPQLSMGSRRCGSPVSFLISMPVCQHLPLPLHPSTAFNYSQEDLDDEAPVGTQNQEQLLPAPGTSFLPAEENGAAGPGPSSERLLACTLPASAAGKSHRPSKTFNCPVHGHMRLEPMCEYCTCV